MSNHYHLVVHVDRDRARRFTPEEVVARWTNVYGAPAILERYLSGEATHAERELVAGLVEKWRARLFDIGWFMKCLNEHLARRANAEDGCTGRFWAGSLLHAEPAFPTSM